jgi:ribonucleoside-triphosphate reductase
MTSQREKSLSNTPKDMTEIKVVKRDGRTVKYEQQRIYDALFNAFSEVSFVEKRLINPEEREILETIELVNLRIKETGRSTIEVEEIQDIIVKALEDLNYVKVASSYASYREERTRLRNRGSKLFKSLDEITFSELKDSEIKKENGNIDGNSAMGTMLRYGSESSKEFILDRVMNKEFSSAHREGFIHVHDMDFYTFTTTCTQIDLAELFRTGFNTGHGFIRPPRSITTAGMLCAVVIQSNQNDQHGGQSIPNFDLALSPFVRHSFNSFLRDLLRDMAFVVDFDIAIADELDYSLSDKEKFVSDMAAIADDKASVERLFDLAYKKIDRATYQAMEAVVYNLNTLNTRSGSQVPFSSINYGTCTDPEARMVVRNILSVTERGLGHGETAIFPIQIFRMQEGVNYNKEDPNYDLFKQAMHVSAKRFFPNFSNQDVEFNKRFLKEGRPETMISYMGCRTRVMADVNSTDPIAWKRGNLSFTTLNLPRLAILAGKGNFDTFFELLSKYLDLVKRQLLERYGYQCKRKVKNFPFLMREHVWYGSENLDLEDSLETVLKHGTLSIGFIGLAETLQVLTGHSHDEDPESQKMGLEIVSFMRNYCDAISQEQSLNFTLLATPAEGLSGRFTELDKKRFGVIQGITDKGFYTNSSHVPVDHKITAFKKIEIEAPYHALENAGHIMYVKMDGDPSMNMDAYEKIIRAMHDKGAGYAAINFDQDRCTACGHIGIIGTECPKCGAKDSEGYINRIRRITGYLVGNVRDKWNRGKLAELKMRVNT